MKKLKPNLPLTAIALGMMMASGSVVAQIEEIIVTAEFREENVQDTPIAITAVTADMLEARSQTNVAEIAAQAPNVTLKPAGSGGGPSMIAFIRGIGQVDFNFALEPGVGIYIDDIYYPTLTGSLVDMMDLERLEVLRGPQGTLAGKNAIGGAIKMYSKKPTGDESGSVSIGYGSYDRVELRASADFTLVPDTLFARVAGVSKHRDGYVDRLDYACAHPGSNVPSLVTKISDCKLGTEGGQAYTGARISLRWLPSDNLEINFAADITNDDSDTQPNVLIRVNEGLNATGAGPFTFAGGFQGTGIPGTDGNLVNLTNAFVPYGEFRGDSVINDGYVSYATYLDPHPFNADNHQRFSPGAIPPISTLLDRGMSTTIDWEINEQFSLKSISSYREYESQWASDADASPVHTSMLLQTLEHEQWSQEFRLNGTVMDDKLDFTTGVFLFEQDGTLEANVNLYYVQFNFIHGPDPTPSSNYAAFAHGTYHFNDDLNLSVGVRFSDDEKTYTHFRRNPDGTLPSGTCVGPPHNVDNPTNCALFGLFNEGATFEDQRVDWRVALDYQFTDNVMGYAQVATGYKGGGVNPRPFVLPQLLPFNSEELVSYELGFKTELFDRSMRLNGAVFYNDYTDIIMSLNPCPLVSPGPCALPINAGTAEVLGYELEMEWYPTEGMLVDASLSTIDFDYKTTIAPIETSFIPPYTPELQWSLGAQYTWDTSNAGAFTARIDASYQDEVFSRSVNSSFNQIDDYTLSNLRLMWRSSDESWNAAFEVTNLTDEYYYQTLSEQYESGTGVLAGQPGLPRMYGVTLRRNFN